MAKSVEIREIANGFIIRTAIKTEHPDGRMGFDVTEEFSPTNPLKERGPSVVGAKEPIVSFYHPDAESRLSWRQS